MSHRFITDERGVSKTLVLFGIAAATLVFFLIGHFANSGRDLSTSVEYTPPNGPAIVSNSVDLYRLVGNDKQYNFLKDDLAVFGRKTIDKYKSGKVVAINFSVKNKAARNNDKISFEGKYDESKDTIAVTITQLKNDRILTSITNKKTNTTLDSELPSNTKRNQFIATLPYIQPTYSINYASAGDSFTIQSYDGSDQTRAVAEKYLADSLGVTDLSKEKYSVQVSRSAGTTTFPSFD